MDRPFRGRIALVTGGARRVGKAIAHALAWRGADIALHYGGSADDARRTADELRELDVRVETFQADLLDAAAPEALMTRVVDDMGALNVLVNSAAVMLRTPVGEVTLADWERMFALNVRAPFFLAQAAAPHLRERGGCIVNICDLAAYETWPAYVPHGMTKAAVVQMTRALARTLAPEIRVNGVAPGAVLLPDEWDQATADRLVATTPLKALGSAEDVAQAVAYLCEAEYVTGDVIMVDGGRHVRT
jgi:pteridine reductase